jgi:5'-3' exonuclease
MVVALIDGDIILYRIGWTTQLDNEAIARVRADDLVDSILTETGATEYELWLSDNKEKNFRFNLWKEYKANRTQPRPKNYEAIKVHLVSEWGARIAHGMEADDALGIGQGKDTIICSIDKDLLQIPGKHYNFVRKEWMDVTPWEGLQWFYKQILIGDTSDNIQGCKGIGAVKAGKAIDPIPSSAGVSALFEKVVELYKQNEVGVTTKELLEHILLVGRLLKIKQKEDEPAWRFPKSSLTMDTPKSSSTLSPQAVIIPSMVHTTPESMVGSSPHGVKMEPTSRAKSRDSTLQRN